MPEAEDKKAAKGGAKKGGEAKGDGAAKAAKPAGERHLCNRDEFSAA